MLEINNITEFNASYGIFHQYFDNISYLTPPKASIQDSTYKIVLGGTNDVCVGLVENPYIEFSFNDRINIFLTSYYMRGRTGTWKNLNHLVSWQLSGKNKKGKRVIVHEVKDKELAEFEERNYTLSNVKESFTSIRITATEKSSTNNWYVCFAQLEIFGYVSNKPLSIHRCICTNYCRRRNTSLFSFFVMVCFSV